MTTILSGEYKHDDFSRIRNQLGSDCRCIEWEELAKATLGELSTPVELIVIAQSRRGVYPDDQILALKNRFPLIPIVGLLGSWCEGETRSGSPQRGWIRVLWHRWDWQFEEHLLHLQERSASPWHEPMASLERHKTSRVCQFEPNSKRRSDVLIDTRDRATFETYQDICSATGATATWAATSTSERMSRTTACIIDCNSIAVDLESQLNKINRDIPTRPPTLVVCGFPRRYELATAMKSVAVHGVISKPFEVAEIQAALNKFADLPKISVDRVAG